MNRQKSTDKSEIQGGGFVFARGIGAAAVVIGILWIVGVWVAAALTAQITSWGACLLTGLVVFLGIREVRARNVMRVGFELGYRIGQRDGPVSR